MVRSYFLRLSFRKIHPLAESTFALFVLQAAIKDRKSLVDTHRTRWGDDWIILPNPAYGEWTRPLGRGNDDLNRLAPELK